MSHSIFAIPFTGDAEQQQLYQTLMCFGFLGAMYRKHEEAQPLLDVVETLVAGDKRKFQFFRSMAEAGGGRPEYAIQTMNERLRRNPDDDFAKISLGTVLRMTGDPEWRYPLDNVLATSIDQAARKAALDALNPPPRRPSAQAGLRPG